MSHCSWRERRNPPKEVKPEAEGGPPLGLRQAAAPRCSPPPPRPHSPTAAPCPLPPAREPRGALVLAAGPGRGAFRRVPGALWCAQGARPRGARSLPGEGLGGPGTLPGMGPGSAGSVLATLGCSPVGCS